jgi:hypothetical protein
MREQCRLTSINRAEEKMYKQWEKEPWRIEHADDATITFTIAVHGKHAWEMLLEDDRRYHSISHGWATDDPHHWDDVIAPLLRQFFAKGRLEPPQCMETYAADARGV